MSAVSAARCYIRFTCLLIHMFRYHTACGKCKASRNGRVSVRPSVCLSRRETAAAVAGGFAAEVGHGQQISIDSGCCRATCRPRKYWSDVRRPNILVLNPLWRCRMVSARTKAEQAQDAARKAAADAEIALSTARQYSPAHSQPGERLSTYRICTWHTCIDCVP